MKENKKLTIAILVVVLTIFLISGGTLAYWQWITNADQNTLVSASPIDEASMYIDFPSYESKGLYPTSDCNLNATSSWVTEVTVDNGTGVMVAPRFRLKVKIEDKNGNVITNADTQNNKDENDNPLKYRHFIKYAVTEEYGECNKPLVTGRFDLDKATFANLEEKQPGDEEYIKQIGWYDSNLITIDGSNGFPDVSGRIGTGVSFYAGPNKETTHKYKVWVWMDKEYTYISQGTESSDPFQDAKITVSWSENSTLEQVRVGEVSGEAVAIYSADDNSLRFYRETDDNISKLLLGEINEYNDRTVTNVYTGFENSSSIPWNGKRTDIKTVVFEDYIYPTSTASWFAGFTATNIYDLIKLDTSNVTDMSWMFSSGSSSVSSNVNLDLSHFDTSKVTNMSDMFAYVGFKSLDLSGWNTSNVTNMYGMFSDAGSYSGMSLYGLEKWNTSNVTNMDNMFFEPNIVTEMDLSGWNVCKVSEYMDFEYMYYTLTVPHFGDAARCNGDTNVGKENAVGDAYAIYFEEDNSLRFYRSTTTINPGSVFDGRAVTNVYTGFEDNISGESILWSFENIEYVSFEDYVYPMSTTYWFSGFGGPDSSVENVKMDLTKLDVSNVTNMGYMFYEVYGEVVGLENWDTSKVTNMNNMFLSADVLNNIDLSGWSVCNVLNYYNFSNDSNIIQPHFGDTTTCPLFTEQPYFIVEINDNVTKYIFVEGMTWGDFIASEYNPDYASYSSDKEFYLRDDNTIEYQSTSIYNDTMLGSWPEVIDLIEPGKTYYAFI